MKCAIIVYNQIFNLIQILDLPTDETLREEVSSNMVPYLLEAGVDVELLSSNREMVVQCLLMYNIVEKRKMELDDILVGMYITQMIEIGLTFYMYVVNNQPINRKCSNLKCSFVSNVGLSINQINQFI